MFAAWQTMPTTVGRLLLLLLLQVAESQAVKPHILFILADDLGYGDLGYVGSDIATPRIDALATNGTILTRHYVQSCCTPTRAALHTARYPSRYGLQVGTIPENMAYGLNLTEKLMPAYLKELGYATHMVGKWHMGEFRRAYTPTFRGYDTFLGYYAGAEDYFLHRTSLGLDLHLDLRPNCGLGCSHDAWEFVGNYSAHVFGDRALSILSAHQKEVPLFLYMAFQSVHFPIEVPESYTLPYKHLDSNRQEFAGMLAALDEQVGRLEDGFAAKGLWDQTLTVFSADNGGPVGSRDGKPWGSSCATGTQNWPLRGGKGTMYEGGMRSTAWVHGAMLAHKGQVLKGLMHVVDWVPTFVAAAGGEARPPPGQPLDGVSQWEMLTREGVPSARTDVLLVHQRSDGRYPPPPPGDLQRVGVVMGAEGQHKLCHGGCGLPNNWYHDGLPYTKGCANPLKCPDPDRAEPTPDNQCVQTGDNPCIGLTNHTSGCLPRAQIEVYDIAEDETEHKNLAATRADLLAQLTAVAKRYHDSPYVESLNRPPSAGGTPNNPPGCAAAGTCCPKSAQTPQGPVSRPCE